MIEAPTSPSEGWKISKHSSLPSLLRSLLGSVARKYEKAGLEVAGLAAKRSIFWKRVAQLREFEVRKSPLGLDETNEAIRGLIQLERPALIGRFSKGELEAVLHFHRARRWSILRKAIWALLTGGFPRFDPKDYENIRTPAGYIEQISEDTIAEFHDMTLEAVRNIDLLGSWVAGESQLLEIESIPEVTLLKNLWPFFSETPWTHALEGKRVLVVHPFSETIEKQYELRSVLHQKEGMLPSFDLVTISPPWRLLDKPGQFVKGESWVDQVHGLIDRCLRQEFEVAIIGAGAYGLPLGSAIKKSGRIALVVGSLTQLLFGIRGKRWERIPDFSNLMNEHWCRPSSSETPPPDRQVEESAYW